MSPAPGGESDKIGNRYEQAWTVRHLIYVLVGHGESIKVEDRGEIGDGSEFTFRADGEVHVHQVKRQHGLVNNWSVRSLQSLGIWKNAQRHVALGRTYHFVSTIPFQHGVELIDFARRSASPSDFQQNWLPNKPLRDDLVELKSDELLGSMEEAWTTLRGMTVQWPDERELDRGNAALASLLFEGVAGQLAIAGLSKLVIDHLGVELTAPYIDGLLPKYGLRRTTSARSTALGDQVRAATSRWLSAVSAELLHPVIRRDEAMQLEDLITSDRGQLTFLVGTAGGGKSAVLHQTVERLTSQGTPTLVFRLDRLDPFASSEELGAQLDINASPVTALASAAAGAPSVLVVDQVDAVSFVSGRMPSSFDVIADLIREATAFPQMRVVLVSRKFDLDNDERIRGLAQRPETSTVTVGQLTDEQVNAAVQAMGLRPEALETQQRDLLRVPLHLVLLSIVVAEPNALRFETSMHLFDAYWDRKARDVARDRPGTKLIDVLRVMTEAISSQQRLSVPMTVLDKDGLTDSATVLVSQHILVRYGREIAFFHEAFFDYAFARLWIERDESLTLFLESGEQELFRRAQVRQIMTHLRSSYPERFLRDLDEMFRSDAIRVHIKEAALAVLGVIADPQPDESDLMVSLSGSSAQQAGRIWSHLRTVAWFQRLDADGHVEQWLASGDQALQERALQLIAAVARGVPDRLAGLLAAHRDEPTYASWLRWIVRFAEVQSSQALFDLLCEGVGSGLYRGFEDELWFSIYGLAERRPRWMVDLFVAYLLTSKAGLTLGPDGQVAALNDRRHSFSEMAAQAAKAEPAYYIDKLLPYLLVVMSKTQVEHSGEGLPTDAHFSHRDPGDANDSDLGDALFHGMAVAIKQVAGDDADEIELTIELLALSPHDAAQWLLYQGLIASGESYAERAAEILLEQRSRIMSGYAGNGVWTTRELLQVIGPHVDADTLARIESLVRDLQFSWERRRPGWYAFTLLSALDESRLSDLGRRRLGEYRRLFGVEQPGEPTRMEGGFIGSPIPDAAAPSMSDTNWLQAMNRHHAEREDWTSFTGGARELSRVLQEQVKQDPERFARLSLSLTSETNPAYGDAILVGLGEAEAINDDNLIYSAIRHIASFGHEENDRWLGWPLRLYMKQVPLDLVELLRDRALTTTDPSDDGMRIWGDREQERARDIVSSGINTARGSLVNTLANLVIFDGLDGTRADAALPVVEVLSADPSMPVRACVARLIRACIEYQRPEAIRAFWRLIDAPDILLATEHLSWLIRILGDENPASMQPVVERMLASSEAEARSAGAGMATFAALEWALPQMLELALSGDDATSRAEVARVCAHRLVHTSNVEIATATLIGLMDDESEAVRKAAAEVAVVLRGQALQPYRTVVQALMSSRAFSNALPQLLISLERAPDRVSGLVLTCAQSFVALFGADAADVRAGSAGEARDVAELVIRALAQSRTSAERAALLDVLDELLLVGAYGVEDVIGAAER
ncbi:hypothetical protein ACIB24_08210 [Spongisporangium articulatum]|uniref:ATP-binding protein n=1 Tax=Spongisporangium articulatum TaxID=3362603 RepID=A0ABW8AN63_9ACTN